jgi:hypothetical protein
MVFVMAASVAITLYMEVPRVAFESQRVREQLLVDRGEQYKRAIQVFYRKNKRYPSTIEELESFQNVRSLRHRYKDPMTGKDEWRLIHVGPGGMLTDSLVQKQQNPFTNGGGQNAGGIGPGGIQNTGLQNPGFQVNTGGQDPNAPTGANGQPAVNVNGVAQGQSGLNMALARRPSDRTPAGGQGGPAPVVDPNDPNAPPVQPLQPNDPNQPYPPGTQPPAPNVAGFQPGQPGSPTGLQPYNPNNPTQPGQPGSFGQFGQLGQNGQNGQNSPGGFGGGTNQNLGAPGQNAAMNAIQQAIMSPRQPPAGLSGGSSSFGTQTTGGIAGVATTFKGGSIKVINERKKYQEWEFVYDIKKDKTVMGNAATGMQQQQQQQVQGPGFSTGSSSFGNNGGNTGNTGFGGAGGGSTMQPGPMPPTQPNPNQ